MSLPVGVVVSMFCWVEIQKTTWLSSRIWFSTICASGADAHTECSPFAWRLQSQSHEIMV
jgi:hypothetical protein